MFLIQDNKCTAEITLEPSDFMPDGTLKVNLLASAINDAAASPLIYNIEMTISSERQKSSTNDLTLRSLGFVSSGPCRLRKTIRRSPDGILPDPEGVFFPVQAPSDFERTAVASMQERLRQPISEERLRELQAMGKQSEEK